MLFERVAPVRPPRPLPPRRTGWRGPFHGGLLVAVAAAVAACSPADDGGDGTTAGGSPDDTATAARPAPGGGAAAADPAEVPRVAFRAAGMEPTWAVHVIPGAEIRLVVDDRGTELTFPAPDAPTAEGGVAVWRAQSQEGTEVEVRVTEEPCEDESAERRPYTVTVRSADLRFRGCGRPTG